MNEDIIRHLVLLIEHGKELHDPEMCSTCKEAIRIRKKRIPQDVKDA